MSVHAREWTKHWKSLIQHLAYHLIIHVWSPERVVSAKMDTSSSGTQRKRPLRVHCRLDIRLQKEVNVLVMSTRRRLLSMLTNLGRYGDNACLSPRRDRHPKQAPSEIKTLLLLTANDDYPVGCVVQCRCIRQFYEWHLVVRFNNM